MGFSGVDCSSNLFRCQKRELNAVFWSGITLIPVFGFISFVAYILTTHIEEDRPFDLLQQRLFSGEITENEYLILHEDLKQSYLVAAD